MAKPQTEEGFVMIALDLFVAIMTCDLPNREAIILAEILTQSYGPAKRRNVVIDPATIEDVTGLHRNNVRRALAGLVAANIIARNEDGTYRFLKDWENYESGGERFTDRLSGGLKRFALNVKARFGRIKRQAKDPIPVDSHIGSQGNPTGLSTSVKPNPTGLRLAELPQSNGIVPTADMIDGKTNVSLEPGNNYEVSLASAGAHAELDFKISTLTSKPAASPVNFGSFQECVEFTLEWGTHHANNLTSRRKELTRALDGREDPSQGKATPRWDCLLAALKEIERRRELPGAQVVHDPIAYACKLAKEWAVDGIPEPPIALAPKAAPPRTPRPAYERPVGDEIERVRREMEKR